MSPLDIGWLASAMLLSLRLGVLAVMAPPLGASSVPVPVRVSIVLTLSAFLAGLTRSAVGTPTIELGALMTAALSELALGAVMALGLNIAFAMFSFGAHLIDVQMGFGMGQVLDPMTRQPTPVLGAAFSQLALLSFFALDGHHALMRGLVLSIEHFPPGAPWMSDLTLGAVTRHVSQLFSLGFAMVAPVVLCLMLVELGLGVLARNLPQINALVLGFPIKVMAGLAALTLWTSGAGAVVARAHASVFVAWEALWR